MVRGGLPRGEGLTNLRIGAIGARPTAFNTVRYSEKLLEASGISVETLDLTEVLGRIGRMKDNDDPAQAKLAAIKKYVSDAADIPEAALMKMAKLGAVIDQWMEATRSADQRGAVLDLARRISRRGAVHGDEHDERIAALERVRSGRLRRAGHACAAAGFGNAERAAGLEQ